MNYNLITFMSIEEFLKSFQMRIKKNFSHPHALSHLQSAKTRFMTQSNVGTLLIPLFDRFHDRIPSVQMSHYSTIDCCKCSITYVAFWNLMSSQYFLAAVTHANLESD